MLTRQIFGGKASIEEFGTATESKVRASFRFGSYFLLFNGCESAK
jgi:hypothetical protein